MLKVCTYIHTGSSYMLSQHIPSVALQQEVREVCGEETSDSYQEMVDTLQQKIDSASE